MNSTSNAATKNMRSENTISHHTDPQGRLVRGEVGMIRTPDMAGDTTSRRIKCALNGLTKSYGDKQVVAGVSLDIEEGEFVVLLGPSGCGKTSTLRLIAGLEVPDGGEIFIDGSIVSSPARKVFKRPEHRDIGMVFQSYAVWPHMTVFENVAYPLRVRRWRKEDIRAKVHDVLNIVGLAKEAGRSATALSGGQMQRIALARALVFDPALLLFDEPLSNLDLKLRERLRIELKEMQQRTGLTSIYVTHDQGEAVELGDRIVVMEGGKVVQIGGAADLYQAPSTRFVADFIGTANICSATIEEWSTSQLARVRTEHGRRILATCKEQAALGDKVDLVVHPEDCHLALTGAASDSCYPVQVLRRRYQGIVTRYTVAWEGAPFEVVTLGTSSNIPEGARAWLSISPDRAWVIQGVAK